MAFMLCGGKHLTTSMDSLALQESRQAFMAENNLPEVNQDVEWMDAFCVIIPRGKKGFGFTVTGSCPVRVGQVKEGSTACNSGLQKDDAIVKINGKNVSRSIADTVAKIVRNSENEVTLECYRATPLAAGNTSNSDQCVPDGMSNLASAWSPYSPPEGFEHLHNQKVQQQQQQQQQSPNQVVPRSELSVHSSPPCLYHVQAEVHAPQQKVGGACAEGGVARTLTEDDWQDESFQRTSTPTRLQSISCMELRDQEQERGACIHRLHELESSFVACMQFGIERYLQPLRYSVVAPTEHGTLFQNIERLVAMADFNAQLLKKHKAGETERERSRDRSKSRGGREEDDFAEVAIGTLYQRHVPMLCEAYETYCAGAKSAIRLLAELKKDEAFQSFLADPPLRDGQQTLGTFLQRPLQHMKELVMQLQAIYTHSPSSHTDQQPLKQVIQALRRSCSAIYQNNTRLCRSTFSLVSAQSFSSLLLDSTRASASVSARIPSPLREFSPEESNSVCSFRSKTFSDHSDSGHSEKSAKSHHSQDSGISVRKSSEEESANNSPSSAATTSGSGFPSGFPPGTGTLCHRCKKERAAGAGATQQQAAAAAAPAVIRSIHSEPAEVELSSIDSEVLDIQSRLLFGNDIGSFRIASSTRHMIYAGDLLYNASTGSESSPSPSSSSGGQWSSVYAVLLSDLLLVTRVESDNYLTVLEEPIVLQDVTAATWTCLHDRDFQITVTCEECANTGSMENCRTTFTFRAPSAELKHTWQNIVDQRIIACKTQPDRDNIFGKVLAEFI